MTLIHIMFHLQPPTPVDSYTIFFHQSKIQVYLYDVTSSVKISEQFILLWTFVCRVKSLTIGNIHYRTEKLLRLSSPQLTFLRTES